MEGVDQVRTSPRARSLVVHYDGRPEVRSELLTRLRSLSPYEFLHHDRVEPHDSADPWPMIESLLALLALPLLPLPLRAAVTLAAVSPTLYKGAHTLFKRGVKVEVLDALAVSIAAGQGSFFTANATHLLIQSGLYLEARAERHAHRLLHDLLKRPPASAWVERDGSLVQVEVQALREGETVTVGPGDPIPVDGIVVHGTALVDQSSLTGESVPVRREATDSVLSGCLVVEGRLSVKAERVGDQTATARLGRFIEQALQRPSEGQRLADRLGDRLVYLTFALGGLVFALTLDPRRLASVFLVDYSCALKLGTPLAFKAGMHGAARAGILFRGAQSMETLASADTVVFDKTGTLTYCQFEITDILPLRPEHSEDDLLALVASLEEHTHHPFAEALVRYAEAKGYRHIDHGAVEFVIAHGAHTDVNGNRIYVGSRHYLEEHIAVSFATHEGTIAALANDGKTLLYVAENDRLIGIIGLRDQLREDARPVLGKLKALGIEHPVMLTGDTRHKSEALARYLGIDRVHAEQAPEQKALLVEELKATGHTVVFVGDGINDASALLTAHVGITMPRGALLAREAADVILLHDSLEGVAQAREFALRTQALIRSNFHLDVALNSGLLLAATFGWVPAVAAALLHNGTTLAILLRSIRSQRLPTGPEQAPGCK